MEKHADELDENDIDKDDFKDLLVSILGGYAQYRPDIGFISGLEKLTA